MAARLRTLPLPAWQLPSRFWREITQKIKFSYKITRYMVVSNNSCLKTSIPPGTVTLPESIPTRSNQNLAQITKFAPSRQPVSVSPNRLRFGYLVAGQRKSSHGGKQEMLCRDQKRKKVFVKFIVIDRNGKKG